MPVWARPGDRLPPALSGLLLFLAFPPFHLLLPSFLALVPFLVHAAGLPAGREGRRAAARAGGVLGLVYFGLLLHWLVPLVSYSSLAVPAYLLTVLALSAFTAAFGAGLHLVRERTRLPPALAEAVLWTAMEWLQAHLGDLAYPWLGLGASLSGFPRLAGIAELVGSRGVGFWLVLVNGLVASAVAAGRAGRARLRPATLAAAAAAVPAAFGVWRAGTLELRPAARVAVVQPAIPQDLKLDRDRAADSSLTALARLTERIPPGSVDLVVWPEAALPVPLEHPSQRRRLDEVRELSRRVGAPIVAGTYGTAAGPGGTVLHNSALPVTAAGPAADTYHKRRLVPFVERVPFVDPRRIEAVAGELRHFGALGRGRSGPAWRAAGSRYGVLICYESAFPALARSYRRAGADFLVNITNDAWFGGKPWYTRTGALWQHPAHLPMRAIEERVGIARAANTGISLFVDPLGQTHAQTALHEPAVRVATVYTTHLVTLYARWGDWLATAAAVASALLLALAWWRGRRLDPTGGPRAGRPGKATPAGAAAGGSTSGACPAPAAGGRGPRRPGSRSGGRR